LRRHLITTAFTLAAAASLSACGDAVDNAASTASQEAKNAAAQVAKDTAKNELCRYVSDNTVTPTEAIALKAAADVAQSAGVNQQLVDAARTVANVSSGNAPQNDVEKLAAECKEPA
jgi:ABC-type Fe3+-hydroxamate transport system substrate-binding protein